MPADCFGSHFSQNGAINVISWQNCHIFNYLSIDTHIGHMATYANMATIWPYGHMSSRLGQFSAIFDSAILTLS